MDPTPQPDSGQSYAAAAAESVTPDSETAALLQKHAAYKAGTGEKPTAQEFGKLGAFAKAKKKLFGIFGGADEQANTPGATGQPAVVASLEPGEAPVDGLEPVDIDEAVCRRIAGAILSRADSAAVGWIEREARGTVEAIRLSREEGEKVLARFRRAAGLSASDQKLVVDLSPDVCRQLGIDPSNFALLVVAGVLGLHAVNLRQCVAELRDMRKERKEADRTSAPEKALGSMPQVKIVEPPSQ